MIDVVSTRCQEPVGVDGIDDDHNNVPSRCCTVRERPLTFFISPESTVRRRIHDGVKELHAHSETKSILGKGLQEETANGSLRVTPACYCGPTF